MEHRGRRSIAIRTHLSKRTGTLFNLCNLVALCAMAPHLVGSDASAAEPFRMTPALAAQLSRVECRIVGGRIRLTSQRIGGQMSSSTRGNGRVQETLALDLSSSLPRLAYQADSDDLRLTVAISAGDDVAIVRSAGDKGGRPIIDFKQQREGPVELSWHLGEQTGSRREPTVWHLWLAEPQLCQQELAPLLQLVRPNWDLQDQGAAVEDALLNAARQTWTDNWPRWTELVGQLADDSFSRRRAADRELRASGLPVVPFLHGLNTAKLEPEQRTRIRRIVAGLTRFDDEDSPDRIAVWMVGDPRIWLTLMSRDDPALRRTAASELSEILGRPIEFDPDGGPASRQQQLEQLKRDVDKSYSQPPSDN